MTHVIKGLKAPKNITKRCLLFGLCNVFHQFVLSFAHIGAPQSQNLKKDQPTHFGALTADELNAIRELQNKLVSPLILELPYSGGSYTLDTDACNAQLGCVLIQEQQQQQVEKAWRAHRDHVS